MADIYFDPHAPEPTGYTVVHLPSPASDILAAGDPAWREAQAIEWGPDRYRTRFQACWDPAALHVRWDAVDDSPWSTMTRRDEHIWEEEAVELFLDPAGTGRDYAELQISPANVVCDLRVETPWPSLKSLTDWDWEGMSSAVTPLKDPHGDVEGWTAIARLPWAALRSLRVSSGGGASAGPLELDFSGGGGASAPPLELPPEPGQAWRFNVFRIKRPGGPKDPETGAIYAAWSRPGGPSFHDVAAFRPMRFAGRRLPDLSSSP